MLGDMLQLYKLSYAELAGKYYGFVTPFAEITIGKSTTFLDPVGDLQIDLTSDFPASIASFMIVNRKTYSIEQFKKYLQFGEIVKIRLGYDTTALKGIKWTDVFYGVLVAVEFFSPTYSTEGVPGCKVTAMDVKGMMMANSYAKQIQAKSYAEVVKKILEKYKDAYQELKITQTPDQKTEKVMIPMVSESDYEFVVKAAKKWNFEFFTRAGTVIFRKAKSNAGNLIKLRVGHSILQFSIEYSINGLVNQIEVRSVDTGKAEVLAGCQKKIATSMNLGKAANKFFKKSQRVYIDPTVGTKEDAGRRAEALKETMQYRFGTLNAVCIGMPDLFPGSWITIEDSTGKATAKFYLTEVKHVFNSTGYQTRLNGKSATPIQWPLI